MRLDKEMISKIIQRLNSHHSIRLISEEFNLGKSTVYYYYNKIRGKHYSKPHFNCSASEIEGEIVGIFAGDGSQYFEPKKYSYEVNVHFGKVNEDFAIYVKKLYENFFNKKFRLQNDSATQLRLRAQSKEIFHYFKKYIDYDPRLKHCTVKLNNVFPHEFIIGFLRGLFDTDGCLCYSKREKRFRIFYTTTSAELAKQVCMHLRKLNVDCNIYTRDNSHKREKMIYIINILKASTHRFIKKIQPFKARRAGNSVW